MSRHLKWLAALALLGVCLLGAAVLLATAPEPPTSPMPELLTAVRVVSVAPETVQLRVRSQGTVAPRTESALIPEVSGRVVWISPSLVSGGFFETGQPLLRIAPLDYEAGVARARANLARADGEFQHAAQNLARYQRLSKRDISSTAQLDDARRTHRVAEAVLDEARIALAQAERDLDRTEIRALFSGRVRDEHVDLGQFVSRGASIGTIYATDFVEMRLPIPDAELAYLDLPLLQAASLSEDDSPAEGPSVSIHARFAGADHVWTGHIVRTEGEIDPKSRMVHVVARVENPYAIGDTGRPPLAVGLFVQAEIAGPRVEGVTVVPRAAMRDDNHLMVVDSESRLRLRAVDVLRVDGEDVLIRTRLAPGERVCVSPLQAVIDGMPVRVLDEQPARPGKREARS
jgi:RND family efflux transporter MFP subunit